MSESFTLIKEILEITYQSMHISYVKSCSRYLTGLIHSIYVVYLFLLPTLIDEFSVDLVRWKRVVVKSLVKSW